GSPLICAPSDLGRRGTGQRRRIPAAGPRAPQVVGGCRARARGRSAAESTIVPADGRVNCDRIAGCYRWLEYAGFGRALEHRREAFLSEVAEARRVLVLGDGDGRALAALL